MLAVHLLNLPYPSPPQSPPTPPPPSTQAPGGAARHTFEGPRLRARSEYKQGFKSLWQPLMLGSRGPRDTH